MAATAEGKIYLANFAFKDTTTLKVLYVSLHTAQPTQATPSELSGSGYQRVLHAAAGWTVNASTGNVENFTDIRFPAPTSLWVAPTHFGIYDALTGGNLLFHGDNPFSPAVGAPNVGHVVSFSPGQINLDWS